MRRTDNKYMESMAVTCNFVVVGCGLISEFHIGAIGAIDDAVLMGVYDSQAGAAREKAEKYGVRCYASFEEVLADDEVDALCICTPSYLHASMAARAMQAGKSVLVEKPLALSLEDCDYLAALGLEKGVQVGVVSQLRFSPAISTVKKALEQGVLGHLTRGDLYMKYYRSQEYYDNGDWRGTIEKDGGGALMNQGIHGVDLLRYLMGPVKSIYALSGTLVHDIEVEDTLSAALLYQSGAQGVIEASTGDWPGAPRRIELNGQYGVIILEEDRIVKWEVEGERGFGMYEQPPGDTYSFQDPSRIDTSGHILQLENFISAIRGDTELFVNAREGRHALEIVLGAYRSAELGQAVQPAVYKGEST